MSKKDVDIYYQRMVSDYTESKRVLAEMEKCITDDSASQFLNSIEQMKERVRTLEVNYKRLSYVMFLLNMPNKKEKKNRYKELEQKKLADIPEEHREEAVIKENKEVIDDLKSFLN